MAEFAEIVRLARESRGDAVELVERLLETAVARRASDLHIEPTPGELALFIRVDGVLRKAGTLDPACAPYVVGRIKVLADLLTYRTDIPQEGRIPFEYEGAPVDLRISIFPTVSGEKVVVRVFDPSERLKSLDQLGLPPHVLESLGEGMSANDGIILFTGPAGSGKTTTIYACLSALVPVEGGRRSIVTIEDPIEFRLDAITQTETDPRVGLTFASSLSHLLRHDPEVLMVGEIRDAETARIAVEAGLTGHLLLSTMHCIDCAGAFSRLLDMGIEPYLVTSSVRLVVAQRLLRRLCQACRTQSDEPTGTSSVQEHFEAAGCSACLSSGYSGRVPVAEALPMNDALRRAILEKSDWARLAGVSRETGEQRTLLESALDLVRRGETTLAEVGRVFGKLD